MNQCSLVLLPSFMAFGALLACAPLAAAQPEKVILLRPGSSKVFGFKSPPPPAGKLLEGTKTTRLVDITNISVTSPRGKKGKAARASGAGALVEVEAKKTPEGLEVSTIKRALGGKVYELRFREQFRQRVAKAYRRRGVKRVKWVDGRKFSKDRKVKIIVRLPKNIPSVTVKPGEKIDVKLPGEVEVVEIRGKSRVAEVSLDDDNTLNVVAAAKTGKTEFKLRYLLGGQDHTSRLRVRVK